MNNSVTDPSIHVYACISSPHDYNNNSHIVFEALARKSKTYTDNFLKTLTSIFTDVNTPPVSRFYALYLLAKASELKNDFLMTRMIKSRALLDRVFKDCQFDGVKPTEEKGKKFFSPAPTTAEAILGNNYIRLLLECFLFWNQIYGTDITNNPLYAYRIMHTTLLEKIRFPENLLYFNNKNTTVSDDFHHLPNGVASSGGSPQKSRESPTKPVIESNNHLSPQKPQSTQRSVDLAEEKNPVIKKTREALEQLSHNKNAFKECLENNKDENEMAGLVDYLYNDVDNTYNNQVYPNVDPLIAGGGPSSEKYVTQIFAEGDLVNQLATEHNNYKKGRTPYKEFRERIVLLLRVQPNSSSAVNVGGDITSSHSTKQQQFITPGGPDDQMFRQPTPTFESKLKGPEAGFIQEINYEISKEPIAESTKRATHRIEEELPQRPVEAAHFHEEERRFEETNNNDVATVIDQQIKNQEAFIREPVVPTKEKGRKIVIPDVVTDHLRTSPERKELNNSGKIPSPIHTGGGSLESPIQTQSPQRTEETHITSVIGKPPKGLTTSTAEELHLIAQNKADFRYRSVDTLEDEAKSKAGRSSYNMASPYREGERDSADIDKSLKGNSLKSYSLRNYTPGRTDREGEDLSRSMKISRIKPNDLSMIESSIRQSFVSTGKKPPQFKPLTELHVKEEYEKEINRLKAERDALQKENAILNNDLKEALAKTYRSQGDDTNQVEQLRQLLGQHQQRIEALQEEIVNLQNENMKLSKSNTHWDEFNPANHRDEEALRGFQENIRLHQRIRELEVEVALLRGGNHSFLKTSGVPLEPLAQRDLTTSAVNAQTQQKLETVHTLPTNKDLTLSYSYDNTAALKTGQYDSVQSHQSQALRYEPRHLEKVYEVKGQESPAPDSSMAQTPYDINWAGGNPQHLASADSSFYDPEWAATAQIQFDKTLTAQLEQKLPQHNFSAAAFEEDVTIEGREVDSHNQIYVDLRNKIRGAPLTNELKHLKVSCLKAKCPLFENEFIRVGVSSSVVHDTNHHKNMLKMVVYFENKCNQVIQTFISELASTRGLNKVAKPSRLEASLEPGRQVKQQVVTAFDKVPFECLQLSVQVQTAQSNLNTYNIFLPSLLPRFMDFKPVNAEIFRQKWKMKSAHLLKTEEIVVDATIVKTAYDFKKFFGSLVDLKPMDENDYLHGAKGIKLGGIFDLDVPDSEYLLTINILPSQKVVFQIAAYETEHNSVTFLLQALTFLFKKV